MPSSASLRLLSETFLMFQLAIEIVSSARTEDADARKEPATMATMSGANTSRNKRTHRMFHLMNMNGPIGGPAPDPASRRLGRSRHWRAPSANFWMAFGTNAAARKYRTSSFFPSPDPQP